MESSLKNNISTSVSKKEYFGYFAYGFGQCFSYGLVGSFILFFYTNILKISVAAASTIFLIARVWDAVNDPMVAGFMDTRRTKSGKFKGYMKFAPLFVMISSILCFVSPDISTSGKVIYAGITYILWGTVYTISDIPFWSLSAVISDDPQERTSLVTAANLGVFAGIGIVGSVLPPLVIMFGKGDLSKGYLLGVIAIMVVGYAFMMFGYSTIRERVEPSKAEKVAVKDVVNTLKANKHLFKMLIIFFMNLFMNIVNGMVIYFFTYNMGNDGLMTIFGIVGTASALGFFFIPMLTKKFKKKHILLGIASIDIAVRVALYLMGYDNATLLMIMLAATQFLHASAGPIMSTMIAETIEYSEVQTGKRCEAIIFSGQTFTGKLAAAISGALSGAVLTFIGYNANVSVQSPETLNGLFLAISIIPVLGSVIRIIVLSTYKYTEDEYKNDLEILKNRKAI
ncbi:MULTISPECIES: MFS transporter [unclassified Romboutsia]|uniref:MFS transporter n=1 Tax=unclassified Romboutsia TaxID=2626894 RepID=UPI0008231366|nr:MULTISPECIES: MFS transporter [unclassified Romboutsia]SCH45718.1 Thiomethylgalactoside permease II [uncultured Clostridium sp.]